MKFLNNCIHNQSMDLDSVCTVCTSKSFMFSHLSRHSFLPLYPFWWQSALQLQVCFCITLQCLPVGTLTHSQRAILHCLAYQNLQIPSSTCRLLTTTLFLQRGWGVCVCAHPLAWFSKENSSVIQNGKKWSTCQHTLCSVCQNQVQHMSIAPYVHLIRRFCRKKGIEALILPLHMSGTISRVADATAQV